MRKYLVGAAAVTAMLAAPGLASADSGSVGVSVGNFSADGGGEADFWTLNGAYTHDLDNGWTMQFDGEHASLDGGGSTNLGSGYGAVALGMRNDQYAFYGWVGLSDAFVSATQLGIGGQWYLGQMTFNGSLGYADADNAYNVTDIHVDGTYYFNDNLGLGAEYTTTSFDSSGGSDLDIDTWGINGVWRFTGSPFQVNAGYRWSDTDFGDLDTWQLGFSYHFGTDSARGESQSGSSWNGANTLGRETLLGVL
ncbi:porin [Terricaulis sp.]|uniref:porin n=1 Tax=Terricaulis sp. TaxID=2768686 RepID=UPI0037835C40